MNMRYVSRCWRCIYIRLYIYIYTLLFIIMIILMIIWYKQYRFKNPEQSWTETNLSVYLAFPVTSQGVVWRFSSIWPLYSPYQALRRGGPVSLSKGIIWTTYDAYLRAPHLFKKQEFYTQQIPFREVQSLWISNKDDYIRMVKCSGLQQTYVTSNN